MSSVLLLADSTRTCFSSRIGAGFADRYALAGGVSISLQLSGGRRHRAHRRLPLSRPHTPKRRSRNGRGEGELGPQARCYGVSTRRGRRISRTGSAAHRQDVCGCQGVNADRAWICDRLWGGYSSSPRDRAHCRLCSYQSRGSSQEKSASDFVDHSEKRALPSRPRRSL